ncbi:MAG: DUF389 domain-containing protein [Candidatus Dormibacter sp.]
MDADERMRIRRALLLDVDQPWRLGFGIMLGLSVVIASMGMSLNSAAVVIGAMLVAPLMAPILGIAGAIALASTRGFARGLAVVVVASSGSIGLAWLFSAIVPEVGTGLTQEMISRTSPDLRDLVIAVAAGSAGAFAVARSNLQEASPSCSAARCSPT